jgi:hypothetical protein
VFELLFTVSLDAFQQGSQSQLLFLAESAFLADDLILHRVLRFFPLDDF